MLQPHSAGAEAKITVVELPGGGLIKVDHRANPTEFLKAASIGDSRATAAALLGQVVAAQGLSRTPLSLLASHAEVCNCVRTSICGLSAHCAAADYFVFLTCSPHVFCLSCLPQIVKLSCVHQFNEHSLPALLSYNFCMTSTDLLSSVRHLAWSEQSMTTRTCIENDCLPAGCPANFTGAS